MSTLRSLFEDVCVCPLGDAMIAARHNRWQNMNKVILNEFKSKWEEAIENVKDKEADIPVSSGEIISTLTWEGFRLSLARWIFDRYNSEAFEDDVIDSEFPSVEFEQVILHVAGVDGFQRNDVRSLHVEMAEKSWTPADFAKAAFNKLKSIIISEDLYILGHCCTEQSVLNWEVFQLDFDDLNKMALQDSPDVGLDSRGLQFRAFVYALTRVFQGAGCDVISPSLLVFLMSRSGSFPDPFDAVTKKLPMCNDNSSDLSSWRCACEPLFSFVDGKHHIDKSQPMTASAICNAISMIKENDIEKINGLFALLGGIIDFHRIPNGVDTSIISDNTPKRVLDALKLMIGWDTKYNQTGGTGLEHWNMYPADPIRETVLVQSAALVKLLQAATSIHVIILDPDKEWTQRLSPKCHSTETPVKIFSQALTLAPLVSSKTPDTRHRYWKNISTCSNHHGCSAPLAEGHAQREITAF
eukprot:gene25514-34067_t